MTLPTTGSISLSSVDLELGQTANTTINMGSSLVRELAGITSGPIRMSDLRGRNSRGALYITSSTTYIVPANTIRLRAILVGAGGASGLYPGSGGGAGGQVYTTSSFEVVPGDAVTVVVGVGTTTRGRVTSITNPRTGITVSARGGYAGSPPASIGGVGGAGGISFSPTNGTQYGGLGSTSTAGGGGAGPAGPGSNAVGGVPGAGAAALTVQLNTTQTAVLSPGGQGIGASGTGTAIQSLYGAGASSLAQPGRDGVVILY